MGAELGLSAGGTFGLVVGDLVARVGATADGFHED